MPQATSFDKLLAAHRALDDLSRKQGDRIFVADWYCEHPFTSAVLPVRSSWLTDQDLMEYYFQNDTDLLHREISRFHRQRDGITYDAREIFVGAGMTPLLTAQLMMLKRHRVDRIYYIKPLYYTFYYLADLLGIELIALNSDPLDRHGDLKLPSEPGAWLVMCDPVWFMGRALSERYVKAVALWQQEHAGYVIVDGAFQYMRWGSSSVVEATASLARERTFRLICPTKAVALHGVRFSYCLLPDGWFQDFRYAYANTSGSGCAFDRVAAQSIMTYLNSFDSNGQLLNFIRERYLQLMKQGVIRDDIGAEMTYFCFVDVNVPPAKLITMDQVFFDTSCYPGKTRLNLLLRRAEWERLLEKRRED